MSTDLVLVHNDIATEFLETLKKTLTAMQASSESLPVVVSSSSASRIAALIQDATGKGGDVFHGGPPPDGDKTARVIPTVLGGLSDDMNMWQDEAFGPMMGYKVFSDEEEAIRLAKSPGYGLSGSVFTRDLRKALAIARRLETGYV
jgi:acyl-CoA reductase-like NAD-dependent aldehyde dehydrogenase